MTRRNVLVSSRARIRRNEGLLEVETASRTSRIPFREVGCLVVEDLGTTLTAASVASLMEARSVVVLCGQSHMPLGMALPVEGHCRQSELVEMQIGMSGPLRKRLWRRIVRAKIENQARVLGLLGHDPKPLRVMAKAVRSDDADNREGAAAAIYFRTLVPDGGRRDGIRTGPLDYGYAILRGCVARHAAAGGWLLSRGLKHHSQYNAFNLVDDLIEPLRPIVDLVVVTNDLADPMDSSERATLVRTLECLMVMDGRRMTVDACADEMVDSLRAALKHEEDSLLRLPELDGLAYAEYE